MPLTNGSGSGFYRIRMWIRMRIRILLYPAIFIIDLRDANKKLIKKLLFEGTFTSFSKIKSQKEVAKQ
jgi:hypothetical protein